MRFPDSSHIRVLSKSGGKPACMHILSLAVSLVVCYVATEAHDTEQSESLQQEPAPTTAAGFDDDYTPGADWETDRWGVLARKLSPSETPRGVLEAHLLQSFSDPAIMAAALENGAVPLTAPPTEKPTASPSSAPTPIPDYQ